jgi:hypothetical protein
MRHFNTFIYCTKEVSEVPEAYTREIEELLNTVKQNHIFNAIGEVPVDCIGDKKSIFDNEYANLKLQDSFSICESIRDTNHQIDPNSFVVLLTTKQNNLKWFSATDGKNIYINVKDLEKYSNNQSKYPIAYQIVENIFQSLCGITFDENILDERLHKKTTGCINDICSQKSKIIFKLKEGKICDDCKEIAQKNGMSDFEYDLFVELVKSISKPAAVRIESKRNEFKSIVVDDKGNISINGSNLEIDHLHRTIYIFFLIKNKGFSLTDLSEHIKEITEIYQKVKHKGNDIKVLSEVNIEKIRNIVVSGRHNQFDPRFYRIVSELNRQLKKEIDSTIVEEFLLTLHDELYCIKIDPSKVEINSKFKNL